MSTSPNWHVTTTPKPLHNSALLISHEVCGGAQRSAANLSRVLNSRPEPKRCPRPRPTSSLYSLQSVLLLT